MAVQFFIPSVNMMGEGALDDAYKAIQSYGFKKALIVSDAGLKKAGVIEQVAKSLKKLKIDSVVFDKTKPNPTTKNVEEGIALLKKEKCDCIISLGGGSPHDCAKGIALVTANGGKIGDYEGLDQSKKQQFPLISINTTAGTASEMTRFCIITDEARQIKMAIVDKHATPLLSVNDPSLMLGKPAALTAATGMDALTHAVEAYVSTGANPITDACAVKAIELIHKYLRTAVKNGKNMEAREGMAYAQFLAGMAFNNASLGYVHAMAHQLGGFYDLPHGVCNAILLPHVQRYNTKTSANRLKDLAASFNIDTRKMTDKEGADVCIEAICQLSRDVNIPTGLKVLGVKEKDFPTLAKNALKDACAATNPRVGAEKDIIAIFKKAF